MELDIKTVIFNKTYVVNYENLDFFAFRERFPDHKRAEGIDFDGIGKNFYLVYVEDCYDPNVCIVRAGTATEAIEAFVSEKDWADVSEPDINDSPPGHLQISDRGTMYDPEMIMISDVRISNIEVK